MSFKIQKERCGQWLQFTWREFDKINLNQLGQLPFHLQKLDEGNGIEMTMTTNSAQYHQSCRLKFNNTKFKEQTKEYK